MLDVLEINLFYIYDVECVGQGCFCGCYGSQQQYEVDVLVEQQCLQCGCDVEILINDVVEEVLMCLFFLCVVECCDFLCVVGKNVVCVVIVSVLLLGLLQVMVQEKNGVLEKKDFKIGFIVIICVVLFIMVDLLGFYCKQGLNVLFNKMVGWVLICDKMINKEYDVLYFFLFMLIVMFMGVGSNVMQMCVVIIQNINGQVIMLYIKYKDKCDFK